MRRKTPEELIGESTNEMALFVTRIKNIKNERGRLIIDAAPRIEQGQRPQNNQRKYAPQREFRRRL